MFSVYNFNCLQVSLVDILDMYYEDTFTLPNKRLPSNAVVKSSKLNLNKVCSACNTMVPISRSRHLHYSTILHFYVLCAPAVLYTGTLSTIFCWHIVMNVFFFFLV